METHSDPIPQYTVRGSYYDVGFQTGQFFAARIKKFAGLTGLHEHLIPYIEKGEGKQHYDSLVESNKTRFPHYFEELRGIADGSQMSIKEILVLNLFEISILARRATLLKENQKIEFVKSCTDVMMKDEGGNIILGHNEDIPVRDCGWLIHADVSTGSVHETYTAYSYPGYLPGNAFSWNNHGIIVSINYTSPMEINLNGLSVPFVCRSLLGATSIADLISKIPSNCASGVNLNVVSTKEHRLVNIEIAGNIFSVREISNGTYTHCNAYKTLTVEFEKEKSHIHRARRLVNMTPVTNLEDIKAILGDTQDEEYPIYRNGKPPDDICTAATVFFQVKKSNESTVSIYVSEPTTSKPYLEFDL